MQRSLSQLTYAPLQAGRGGPTLMTLHRHNEFAEGLRELALAVNPTGRVLGLQSTKGVYIGRTIVGYTWYLGPLLKPSPVHYGDSLAELERFFWDDLDRQPVKPPELPFLIGDEQGGTIALSMAAATPDLLSGVVAVNPILPIVPGWKPPLAPLDGLPILLVNPRSDNETSATVLSGSALVQTLEAWGGQVTIIEAPIADALDQMAAWLSDQPRRVLKTTD
jgi:pimeloyl-ACP methyl ester carboxylesterase